MADKIMFSQLVALICSSLGAKNVYLQDGDIVWCKEENIDVTKNSHTLSIKWKNYSDREQYLYMQMCDVRYERPWLRNKWNIEYVYHAYYFNGDNCNDYTRFLYKIMADNVDIVDDLGITGHGAEIGRKSISKINPREVLRDKIREG